MTLLNTAQILCVFLAALPFLLMTLRSGHINLKPAERGHQFLLPIAALIYSIVMMLLLHRLSDAMVKAVEWLFLRVGAIPWVGDSLEALLGGLYNFLRVGFGVQLLFNTLVMIGFCLLKRILLPIVRRGWRSWRGLYDATSAHFYDELGTRSVLRQEYSHMRDMLKAAYYTAVVLGYLTCVLSLVFFGSTTFAFPLYPVFAIIVLGEVFFFLDGRTFDAAGIPEGPGDAPNIPDVNCEDLSEELVKVFRDRVGHADERPKSPASRKEHHWEQELVAGDDLDQIAGTYFSNMAQAGETVLPDYVKAAREILHGTNVLIHNPFYRDLTPYLLLPVFHSLLNNHSCLIICGRLTDEEDIINWLQEGIRDVTNLPRLWNIASLDETVSGENTDIGILGFRKLYDMDNLRAHQAFFSRTDLVIMLEPSNLLGTGQMGLRSVVERVEKGYHKVTYAALDRNADGLVDALSHVIRQSVTEVVASPTPESAYCRMFWRAEGPGVQTRILPRISHYLGIGGEIGALAMHKGVPTVHWFSGSKIPLVDLGWNIRQYYAPICQYIHAPREQEELSERFYTHGSLWQADMLRDAFVMVEDEFCNAFEMSRTFAARIERKGFVNILSEAYMLRDYMCANAELFTNDPKAIPSIVPDFARTERNFVLRTLMHMTADDVFESDLQKELSLHGHETRNAYETFRRLVVLHTGKEDIRIQTRHNEGRLGGSRYSKFSYSVDRSALDEILNAALKTAHYVVENEETDRYPMGNRLMDHIEQSLLPGQFFCYDGKYYQVRSISPASGIIVRRAGDHITGRVYYRQMRDYAVQVREVSEDAQDIRGISLRSSFVNIVVNTDGYLELKARNLLPTASVIHLDQVRERRINYKEVLAVTLDNATPRIRWCLCVLMNELFRTLYPNEADYICVTTADVPDEVLAHQDYAERLRTLVPRLSLDGGEAQGIYIIEDSNIDLGILVSVERNFVRILEIITDYLDWYLDPKRPKGEDAVFGKENTDEPEEEEEGGSEEESGEDEASTAGNALILGDRMASEVAKSDVEGEDEELIDAGDIRAALQKRIEYLTFGYSEKETPSWLALAETLEYLAKHRFHDSSLYRTRKVPRTFDEGSPYDPNQPGMHYCDFCGAPLEKGKYDILKDGRERCPECSATAIKTGRQFRKVYATTLDEMERVFNIKIDVPVKVRMANARKVNDGFGKNSFTPTPQPDGRVLGYAQKSGKGYKLLVENGAPEWKTKQTLVHELTHIWQYIHWNDDEVAKLTGGNAGKRSFYYEGMAVWTEIQYLVSMGEKEKAIRYKRNRDMDPSVYGEGMKAYLAAWPVQDAANVPLKKSPFGKFPPIKIR